MKKRQKVFSFFTKILLVSTLVFPVFFVLDANIVSAEEVASTGAEEPNQQATYECTRNEGTYVHNGEDYNWNNTSSTYYDNGQTFLGYMGSSPEATWDHAVDSTQPNSPHTYFYAPNDYAAMPQDVEAVRTIGVHPDENMQEPGAVYASYDRYWEYKHDSSVMITEDTSAPPDADTIRTHDGYRVQWAENHPNAKDVEDGPGVDKKFRKSGGTWYEYRVPVKQSYTLYVKTDDTKAPYGYFYSGDGMSSPTSWKRSTSTTFKMTNNYNDDYNGSVQDSDSSTDSSFADGDANKKYYGCSTTSSAKIYLQDKNNSSNKVETANYSYDSSTSWRTINYTADTVSGEYYVKAETKDGFGNTTTYTAPYTVKLDNTKPTVSISKTAGTEINGYYGYDLELTVNPTDGHSGVDYTTYNIYKDDVKVETITVQDDSSTDGANIVIPLGEIALEHGSGTYHVTATTTDNVNLNSNSSNGAPVQSGDFPIDATGPVITMTPLDQPVGNGYYADLKVLVKANDDFSGVDSITYSVEKDGETIKNNTTVNDDEVTVDLGALADTHGTGTYTITATAEDRFGNVTTPAVTGSWKIDRTEPYVQFSPNGSGGQWVNSIDVVITPSDAHSGVSNYTIQQSYDNGQTWEDPVNVSSGQATTLTLNMDGLNLIKVNVTDKAKIDSGQTTSNIYYIDTIAPVISTNITDEFIYGDEVIIRFPIYDTEEEGIIGNGIYDPEGPSGTFSGIDHSSVVGIVDYTDNDGNQSTFEVTDGDVLTEDGYYELTITASDNAGNTTVLGDVNFEFHDRPTIDVDIDEETGNGGTEGSGGANNPNIDGGQGDLVYPNKPEIAIDEIVLGSGRDDAILEIYYQVQPIEEPIEYDVVHLGTVEGQDGVYDTTMYPIIPFTEEFVRSLEDGTHDIEFWVVDDKGLTSDIDTCQFKADTLAPLLDNKTNVLDYPESEVMVGPDSVLKMTIQTSDQESDDTRRPEFTGTPYEKSPYYNVNLSLYMYGEDDNGTKVESTVKKINELKTLGPTGDLVSGQNVLNNEPSESFVLKVEDYQTEINQLLSQGLTPVFSIELKVDDNRGNYTTLTSKEVYYDESMAY